MYRCVGDEMLSLALLPLLLMLIPPLLCCTTELLPPVLFIIATFIARPPSAFQSFDGPARFCKRVSVYRLIT